MYIWQIFLGFFSAVGPFVILLGILIFIHELGHFLIARLCGVSVEVFSLGFGPKILKFKYKETLYCLSLFPLGGYVKMFGDNPLEDVPKSQQHRGFLYQKVPQKLAIALGGPVMNLLFTLVAFFSLALSGIPAFAPHIGDIDLDSQAYKQGFRSGDKIVSISGKKILTWKDVDKEIRENSKKQLDFHILAQNKKNKKVSVFIERKKSKNIFQSKKYQGEIQGLSLLSVGTKVGLISPNSLAGKQGVKTFDTITHVQNKKIKYFRELEQAFKTTKSPFSISIERLNSSKKVEKLKINVPSYFTKRNLKSFGLEHVDLYIDRVGKNTPAGEAGLKRGDRLISLNSISLSSWKQVLETIKTSKSVQVAYRREGRVYRTTLIPKRMYIEGQLKERPMIGVASASFYVPSPEIQKSYKPLEAILYSGQETWKWLTFISMGLVRLVQGEISPRTMGGPVAIGRMAHKSFQRGWYSFLVIMSIISLSLFFFNLLPIPMLDGGHILFFSLEGILNRRLDTQKLIRFQQVGFVVLASFFVFVFFNDILNWSNSW